MVPPLRRTTRTVIIHLVQAFTRRGSICKNHLAMLLTVQMTAKRRIIHGAAPEVQRWMKRLLATVVGSLPTQAGSQPARLDPDAWLSADDQDWGHPMPCSSPSFNTGTLSEPQIGTRYAAFLCGKSVPPHRVEAGCQTRERTLCRCVHSTSIAQVVGVVYSSQTRFRGGR
jgi:hypothetical protein